MSEEYPQPTAEGVRSLIEARMHLEGPMLPIVHAIQAEYGYVPEMALPLIADALNLTAAEVHGVVSFYHDFRHAPTGRHVVKICRAEACQASGGTAIAEHTLKKLGIDWNGTTENGAVTVEPVYCLGLCACGPAAMVDGTVVGRVDDARMDKLLAEAGA
ncbi:formate dehydrogenase subunit gamma [Rhodobium orientis]|uniref:Formate dehydrogenase subunit gamma n=2 Tax=Rhodobium orientis TaxID=34017 RepID=A0A327JUH0_9HYPH|nr:formate dehydrogenase subunit gamma [Rhodobium orientis]MBB4301337.1 formate dehydrogenase subunit gamma [Rhodobium orientis]MBK5951075.1 formate dehydrogenase subunit gamma [Rhodobium orientis]RAI26878.1 formate dehydrogenase subunit gamma [Rhodobium orientis]